ncbi:MAG: hypothetical protein ACI8S6_000839 [Myxococcota bacterium]|jgi:hypothetical protein
MNTALVDLGGLENLQRIGGKLIVLENEALVRVTDMVSLASVGEKVRIIDNPALPTADAEQLVYELIGEENIGDSISISGNAAR